MQLAKEARPKSDSTRFGSFTKKIAAAEGGIKREIDPVLFLPNRAKYAQLSRNLFSCPRIHVHSLTVGKFGLRFAQYAQIVLTCGLDVRMPKKGLNMAQADAFLEQHRSKAVANDMRRVIFLDSRLFSVVPEISLGVVSIPPVRFAFGDKNVLSLVSPSFDIFTNAI